MPAIAENREAANEPALAGVASLPMETAINATAPASAGGPSSLQPTASTQPLATRDGELEEPLPDGEKRDARLDRLPMQLDVLVKVHSFRVQDLLSMEKGTVIETVHEHTQDVPVGCGGALLMWSEFELLDQQLAVRITRLA